MFLPEALWSSSGYTLMYEMQYWRYQSLLFFFRKYWDVIAL